MSAEKYILGGVQEKSPVLNFRRKSPAPTHQDLRAPPPPKHLPRENPPWRADRSGFKPRELIKKILAAGAGPAQVSIGPNEPEGGGWGARKRRMRRICVRNPRLDLALCSPALRCRATRCSLAVPRHPGLARSRQLLAIACGSRHSPTPPHFHASSQPPGRRAPLSCTALPPFLNPLGLHHSPPPPLIPVSLLLSKSQSISSISTVA